MINIFRKRIMRLLIACLSLLILIDMVQDSYAKYISGATATKELTIAEWSFKINNQDVLANSDFSNTIVPVFAGNTYIRQGVIAPSSTGYFDITIDSTNTAVAYDQTIELSLTDDNTVTDLQITGYSLNSGTLVQFADVTNPTINTTVNLARAGLNTYGIFVQ